MPLPDPTTTPELGKMMTLVLLGPSSAEDTRIYSSLNEPVAGTSPVVVSLPASTRKGRAGPSPQASRAKVKK